MAGAPEGCCKCVQCVPGTSQKALNKELEEKLQKVTERILEAEKRGQPVHRAPTALFKEGFLKKVKKSKSHEAEED